MLPGLAALVAACGGGSSTSAPSGAAGAPAGRQLDPADELLVVPRRGWRTDFSRHVVPLIEFQAGGPGRDGIPAIDRPRFTSVRAANRWLDPREPVIELAVHGKARAYPLQILVWHEIVNDIIGGRSRSLTARYATARWRSSAASARAP